MADARRNSGQTTGLLGILFGLLGIFTIGLLFTPLAALFSIVALLRALSCISPTGILIALTGSFLTVIGIVVSPTLWVAIGLIIGATAPPSSKSNVDQTVPLQTMTPNCSRESDADVRKIVCSDVTLSEWSYRMYLAYDHDYEITNEDHRRSLAEEQASWLKARIQACDLASLDAVQCLLNSTKQRALELEAMPRP